MTALSGGGRSNGHPNPLSSRSDPPAEGGHGQPRPLDQIFPLRGDANRSREMQATWRSFCRDRLEAVRSVLATGRSPPEIAYQLGELLHNHFRTRGVTLTSYELRRLVAELLALHGPAEEGHEPPARESPAEPQPVVAFDREPPKTPWPGDVPAELPAPRVSDTALVPPPSPIVTVTPRESAPREPAAPLERLLARAMDLAKGRLVPAESTAVRAVVEAPAKPASEPPPVPPIPGPPIPEPEPVATTAAKEVQPGLIDRLWSDRAVKAIFVNGPQQVFVEREGALQAVESFADDAQLIDAVTRLAGRPDSGIADFTLPDGSAGVVIFPPAAPAGPVLTVRRAEPGQATLEGLITKGLIDRPTAELLRIGARGRLNMLVSGPRGSGKTALLAALIRDLEPAQRVVTVAGHREFQWPLVSKVELVASAEAPFASLISAAARFEPGLLVLDGVQLEDVAALSERLLRGAPGTLAAIRPEAMSAALARSAELVVRIDQVDGQFRVVAVEDAAGTPAFAGRAPAFAAILQARGFGESLGKLLT